MLDQANLLDLHLGSLVDVVLEEYLTLFRTGKGLAFDLGAQIALLAIQVENFLLAPHHILRRDNLTSDQAQRLLEVFLLEVFLPLELQTL